MKEGDGLVTALYWKRGRRPESHPFLVMYICKQAGSEGAMWTTSEKEGRERVRKNALNSAARFTHQNHASWRGGGLDGLGSIAEPCQPARRRPRQHRGRKI
jgi:hypothetical protein